MNAAPVLRCTDWPQLVAALADCEGLRGLAAVRAGVAAAVLAAPAAVARSLAVRAPHFAMQAEWSLLIVGAESVDAVDEGRWYQAIPAMLGGSGRVRVTLAGASLDTGFLSAASAQAPAVQATGLRVDLAAALDATAATTFDVAMVFQPGFQKYHEWLDARGLARLLAGGTQVFGSSNAEDEYQMERWVLEAHGYRVAEPALQNPFYLELGDAQSSIRWGSVLWQIEAPPSPGCSIDQPRLAALDLLNRMVMHSMAAVGEPSPPCGAGIELTAGDGQRMAVIHLFDRRFVKPADATLLQLTADGQLKTIGQLPETELQQYPGVAAGELACAIWAASIKSRYLLAGYPPLRSDGDGAALARAQFDAMKARAAALFR